MTIFNDKNLDLKNLIEYPSQTCIYLVLSRNLNSYPSLIGIEKSEYLFLSNWCVIDLIFFKIFIMWWSDNDYNYPLSQIVGLVFHFGIFSIFVMFLKLKSINLPSFVLCPYQIQAF